MIRTEVSKIVLSDLKHVHMVGIGGVGMSALASILCDMGIKISGSDLKCNRLTAKLTGKGCLINMGHEAFNGMPDMVIRSYGVGEDNPEIMQARRNNIPVRERSELLKAVMDSRARTVSVCGTHGKTTTTAMISYVMERAGFDPTVLIGGEMDFFEGNSKTGKSDIFITETDESDGFISLLRPRYIVITNLEKEHMEHYGSMDNLVSTFGEFLKNADPAGAMFYCGHEMLLKELSSFYRGKKVSYGIDGDFDICASRPEFKGLQASYEMIYMKKRLGNVVLNVPARHNVLNSLACFGVMMAFGAGFETVRDLIKDFRSVKRRFEIKYDENGIMLVEDYAHHPTEIKSVIDIARKLGRKRIVAVFQPHRYSRTVYLQDEFSVAFDGIDELILTDIYAGNEKHVDGVSAVTLMDRISPGSGVKASIARKSDIPDRLGNSLNEGDILLVMGAGDVNQVIEGIAERLRRRFHDRVS